jgi:hypothetical protein
MTRSKQLLAFCLGAVLIAGVAAQDVKQEKKIYRWVDKSGKVHISDQLPPEMVDQARKEYSASSGTLKSEVRTQMSPEERALAEQQAKLEADALAQAEKAKRIEQGMMINFETEQDLQRSFDERTNLLQQTIASLTASIQSRRAMQISVLNELSDLELQGKPLPAGKIKQAKENHALILKQAAQKERLTANFDVLKGEFAATLVRYRQIKSGQITLELPEAPSSAAAAPDQPPKQ